MTTVVTVLSVLLFAAILFGVLAVLYIKSLIQEQPFYLDTVKMYERTISPCSRCKPKVEENWKKLKENYADKRRVK